MKKEKRKNLAAEVAMVHLLQHYGAGRPPTALATAPQHIARVLQMIEAHIGEDLSHARLAAAAGLSVYGFASAFTRAIGEPPHRYVQRRRCERAREMLAQTVVPIADMAAALGFSSQSHLTTAFLRLTGVTPARYRIASSR